MRTRWCLWLFVWSWLALAQSPLEQAAGLARQKRYAEAAQLLKGVGEPAPIVQRIAFHRLKAAVASGLGDADSAINEMRAALKWKPNDPALSLATALAEFEGNRLEDPERTAALATEFIRQQRFQAAIKALQHAKSAKLLTLLGIAQFSYGELPLALAALQDALRAEPGFEPAYRCLAQIVLQASAAPSPEISNALCSWDRTVCSALQLRAARDKGDAGLQSKAIADLERAPAGNVVACCELARAYDWTGKLALARTQMEKCVHLDPTPQNHYRLGMLYRRLGLTRLAEDQFQLRAEILQRMPEQSAAGLSALEAAK